MAKQILPLRKRRTRAHVIADQSVNYGGAEQQLRRTALQSRRDGSGEPSYSWKLLFGASYVERFIIDAGHTAQRVEKDYGYDLLLFTYDEDGYNGSSSTAKQGGRYETG